MPFLFVGERPSDRARRLGANWRNGRLSAAVLHDALTNAGYRPLDHRFRNLFLCRVASRDQLSRWSLWHVNRQANQGLRVVALGRKVHRALAAAGVPHLLLVHPAARGKIRKRANYRAHVLSVLGPGP